MIRELQERAARAMPAAHVSMMDGWWLRRDPGGPWWLGSVLPHGEVEELAGRVEAVERFYAEHGLVAAFQLTPGACPPDLDALLAARGYARESAVSVCTAPLAQPPALEGVEVDGAPSEAWFDVWRGGQDHPGVAAERARLARVERPTGYATVRAGDRVVAVGRAVVDDGWAGVFGMATRPEARGRGAGGLVLAGLARWAGEHGADRLYLQVLRDNPARRLYERAGFTELCTYHYRVGPSRERVEPIPGRVRARTD